VYYEIAHQFNAPENFDFTVPCPQNKVKLTFGEVRAWQCFSCHRKLL